jgi:hypothetical protein
MKKLIVLSLTILIVSSITAKAPKYASMETKEIIEKMIKSHGGYERWAAMKTFSFSTAMHSKDLGILRFWINDQVVDMASRRSYQDWPLVGSKMSFDGEKVWSVDWRVGNPPSHQHSVFFYYLNLPWLTQDENANLGKAELLKHKAFDNEVYKVKMSYKKSPTVGKSAKDTYTLFIDSKTYLLVGYEYTVGYGPILDVIGVPKDKDVFGPVLRKNNYTAAINGLKYPLLFTTHDADYTTQYGDHAVYNISLDVAFDEARMVPPENAVVDPAIDKRKED